MLLSTTVGTSALFELHLQYIPCIYNTGSHILNFSSVFGWKVEKRRDISSFKMNTAVYFLMCFLLGSLKTGEGLLRPQESETRQVKRLDGFWNFRQGSKTDPNDGFRKGWFLQPMAKSCVSTNDCSLVSKMPVPSSYNDISTDAKLRDHVGWVWYDTHFFVSPSWIENEQEVHIRFGSVHYFAQVWINGVEVGSHTGGHLPFAFGKLNGLLHVNKTNLLTVAVNNTLTMDSLPQGQINYATAGDPNYPPGYFTLDYTFDFFNYAGIHRSVELYTVPKNHLTDVTFVTVDVNKDRSAANVTCSILTSSNSNNECRISLLDVQGTEVATWQGCSEASKTVNEPHLWWPYTLNKNDYGYLYTLRVELLDEKEEAVDVYRPQSGS